MIENKSIAVQLEDAVTALDEVTIGKILTSWASSSKTSIKTRPIAFRFFSRKPPSKKWGFPSDQFHLWRTLWVGPGLSHFLWIYQNVRYKRID